MPFDYIDNSLVDGKKMNYQQAPENEGSKFTYIDEPDVATVRENIEPGIMGETEPPEQKLLNNAKAAATGMTLPGGIAALGSMAGKGLGMLGEATGLTPKLAETAQSQALKAMGTNSTQAQELMRAEGIGGGADEALQLGQKGLDKGLVKPLQSGLTAGRKLEGMQKAVGEDIGAARKLGSTRGPAPSPADVRAQAEQEISAKYGSGLRSAESPQVENALQEVEKVTDPTFTNMAQKATELNQFAKTPRALTQPQEATTDVANIVSRMNNAGLQKVLSPQEWEKYQGALKDFGENEVLKQFLIKKAGKEVPGGLSLNPLKQIGETYHATSATGLNKVANFLSTQAGAKTLPILLNAAKSGPAALSVTDHLLGQFDSEYQNAFH